MDRRTLRTRTQLRAAVLRLLADDSARLTMAAVAEAADINRSTVHQHYRDVDELICDALADRLTRIATELTDCPFAEGRDRPPRQLVALFQAIADAEPVLGRLDPSAAARVQRQLAGSLAAVLTERFRAGRRPPGYDRVRPELHADFVAAGLVALARPRPDQPTPGRLAGQAWRLLQSPTRSE